MPDRAVTEKLLELEREWSALERGIQLCQSWDGAAARRTCRELMEQHEESRRLLQERASGSRSPAAAALSKLELDYLQQVDGLAVGQAWGEPGERAADGQARAEELALYAEYAADHAIQAVRHAQLAALSAIGAQQEYERQECGS